MSLEFLAPRRLYLEQQVQSFAEDASEIYWVSPDGDDGADGTEDAPFQTIQQAVDAAGPGDLVYVKAGTYAPFSVSNSGNYGNPVVISAAPGEERLAVIDGTGTSVRGLIYAKGKSHFIIHGFLVQNAPTDGIFVEGSDEGEYGVHIWGNGVDTTGNAGIYCCGLIMGSTPGVDEYRLFDLSVDGNEVTNTNFPDGGNECITVGGGLSGFLIRYNWVHTSEQYGIDPKLGAKDGEISNNIIHGIEKHGIYLDCAARALINIDVFNNTIYNCNNGIAVARESAREGSVPVIDDILIKDNVVRDNTQYGVMLYKHSRDIETGPFNDVRIASNSIYDNGSDGVRIAGIGGYATNLQIVDNHIYGNTPNINDQAGALTTGNVFDVDPRGLVLLDGAIPYPSPEGGTGGSGGSDSSDGSGDGTDAGGGSSDGGAGTTPGGPVEWSTEVQAGSGISVEVSVRIVTSPVGGS